MTSIFALPVYVCIHSPCSSFIAEISLFYLEKTHPKMGCKCGFFKISLKIAFFPVGNAGIGVSTIELRVFYLICTKTVV